MLKPFQIRGLHGAELHGNSAELTASTESLSQTIIDADADTEHQPAQPNDCHGTVQLSSVDYDEISATRPRARLTYVDNDDGELITVGSSLELSQRLDETIDMPALMQQSTAAEDFREPMHIFDIRRSNSVTELWKKFESKPQSLKVQCTKADGAEQPEEDTDAPADPSATIEPSEPLLAAFEAELAKILVASDSANDESHAQHDPSLSPGVQSRASSSDRPQNPAEAFTHAVHNLVDGAQMIHSGVRSRIPDFERQLRDAQRALPEQVGSTLQSAAMAMESQVRNLTDALHNAAAARSQGRNFNFPGEIPMAANPVDGLRTMASELGQMGHTLFAAFEAELGCNSRDQVQSHNEETGGSSQAEEQTQSTPADELSAGISEAQQPRPNISFEDEKESLSRTEEMSNDRNTSPSILPQQQSNHSQPPASHRDDHTQRLGPGAGLPHRVAGPFRPSLSFNPFYLPPPRPHFPFGHPPPPPPPFQPLQGPVFQPPESVLPWSRFPVHPPPPPPHPRGTWNSEWPSVFRPPFFGPTHHNNNGRATMASTSGSPQNQLAPEARQSANKTLFIGNVGFNVTEKMIQGVFAAQGFLVDVHLPLDSETREHAGFGYLHFASIHAAKAALEALQGTHIDGHSVNLEFSDQSPITNIHTSRDNEQSTSQVDLPNAEAGTGSCASRLPESQQPLHASTEVKQASPAEASPAEQDTNKNGGSSASIEPSNARSEIPALLDRENEDSAFSTRYPSLTPEASAERSRLDDVTSGRLPRLSPELEMSRFPPVSQLDAHMLANQHRDPESTSSPRVPNAGISEGNDEPPVRSRSSPHESSDIPELQDQPHQTLGNTDRCHRRRSGRLLRRSNTMMPAHPESRLSSPFNPSDTEFQNAARARVQEARSLLSNAQNNRPSARRPGSRNTPGGFPTENERQLPVPNRNTSYPSTINRIDQCVTALASLGYGSAEEGGHHRLAVYAAAADGKVNDAIEMIEDERKVYARRS